MTSEEWSESGGDDGENERILECGHCLLLLLHQDRLPPPPGKHYPECREEGSA